MLASTASRTPRLVTIGHTPLYNRGGTVRDNHTLPKTGRIIYFVKEEILLDKTVGKSSRKSVVSAPDHCHAFRGSCGAGAGTVAGDPHPDANVGGLTRGRFCRSEHFHACLHPLVTARRRTPIGWTTPWARPDFAAQIHSVGSPRAHPGFQEWCKRSAFSGCPRASNERGSPLFSLRQKSRLFEERPVAAH